MIKKDSIYVYIFIALLGAIILTSSYYFSLQKNYKICSLIPAIPIMGLLGLFFITSNKGNNINYIINHIKFIAITLCLYLLTLLFLYFKYDIITSLFFSFILWFILVYTNLYLF